MSLSCSICSPTLKCSSIGHSPVCLSSLLPPTNQHPKEKTPLRVLTVKKDSEKSTTKI